MSIPFQALLIQLFNNAPDYFGGIYTTYNYFPIHRLKSLFFKHLPFSFGDLVYALLICLSCYLLFSSIKQWRTLSWKSLRTCLGILALLHFFFLISWGLNYHKSSLSEQKKIVLEYSPEALEATLVILIEKSNALHQQLLPSDTMIISYPFSKKDLRTQFKEEYPQTAGIKNSLWSTLLSYMGYAGYLNPFTGEAQVNGGMPMSSYITTVAHEQAHQLGHAREQEANYLAFSRCVAQENPYLQYAGYTFGLRYCFNAFYRYDPKKAAVLRKKINLGILKDFQRSQQFWAQYKNPLESLFKSSYDQYLKAQGQQAGILSYNLVVAFIVADFQKKQRNPNDAN